MTGLTSHDRAFVRVAACCWMATSITTLGLIFLPRLVAPAPDLLSQAARVENPLYMLRVWIAILHPLIVLVGAVGVLVVRLRAATAAAICGFTFFTLWAGTEGVQQSLVLVALNWRWRIAFLAGADSVREALRPTIDGFDAVSDGLFFFILLAFIGANVMYCAATWSGDRLQRLVSTFFAIAAGLGILSYMTEYGGRFAPTGAMDVAYPLLGPVGRLITGVWLWRQVGREVIASGES